MVGIDGEEEFQAEKLVNNSFEAKRARNVQNLGSNAFNENKDSLQNANRQIINSRTAAQRTTVNNTMPSSARATQTRSVQRSNVSATPNRSLNNSRPQQKSSSPSQKNMTATVEKIQNERKEKEKEAKTNKLIKVLTACVISVALFISMYAVVIFGNIPFVTKWRNIWIETAMTTDQHKWLATCFFPKYLIDEVMNAQVDITDIGKTDINKEEKPDILGQRDLVVGEPDSHGNEVLINDIEQGIVVLKVKTSNYVGRLVLIDDPSRVYITATDYKNSRGEFICNYLEKEDAVIGMNASGFHDPGGTSVGGVVTAQCIAQGEYWGTYSSKYITVGFDKDDRLVVGEFSDWEEYNMRDAFQYHPALIINGDKVIEGSSGWGLQPRSVIGQAENGVVMFFVVDGRQVGYSLGATMGDCADVLEEYGAVNAGACDGGSSSVLAYEGEILNEPSTDMPTGRYLPNAWVVARKTTDSTQTTN